MNDKVKTDASPTYIYVVYPSARNARFQRCSHTALDDIFLRYEDRCMEFDTTSCAFAFVDSAKCALGDLPALRMQSSSYGYNRSCRMIDCWCFSACNSHMTSLKLCCCFSRINIFLLLFVLLSSMVHICECHRTMICCC